MKKGQKEKQQTPGATAKRNNLIQKAPQLSYRKPDLCHVCHHVLGECRTGLTLRRAPECLNGWNKTGLGLRKTLENNFLCTFTSRTAVSSQAWLCQDFLHLIVDSYPTVICSSRHQELALSEPDSSALFPVKYGNSHGNGGRVGQQSEIGSSGGSGSVFRPLGPIPRAKLIKPPQHVGYLAVLRLPT